MSVVFEMLCVLFVGVQLCPYILKWFASVHNPKRFAIRSLCRWAEFRQGVFSISGAHVPTLGSVVFFRGPQHVDVGAVTCVVCCVFLIFLLQQLRPFKRVFICWFGACRSSSGRSSLKSSCQRLKPRSCETLFSLRDQSVK